MSLLKSIYKFFSPKHQTLFLEYKTKFTPRYGHGKNANSNLQTIINNERESYKKLLQQFVLDKEVFYKIEQNNPSQTTKQPTWNNAFLPGLDIVALYEIIKINQPKLYIEIGSGNSTKVARKAITDNNFDTKIISIDPFPRAEIDELADEVMRKPLENIKNNFIFEQLQANDILFIDNSHRLLPNSDVMVCFMEILPNLKPGVIVQIHDVYLPYDYPQFMCDRFYSEQYMLAMLLLANPNKYKTILPNYFISEDKELAEIISPIWNSENTKNVERHGGSYWFKIKDND